jgi:hypothetical protein
LLLDGVLVVFVAGVKSSWWSTMSFMSFSEHCCRD